MKILLAVCTSLAIVTALDALMKELGEYGESIGAERLKDKIALAAGVATIGMWIGLVVLSFNIGSQSHRVLFVMPAVLFGAIPAALMGGLFEETLMSRLYEPRFGEAISAKREELKRKYALAL